MKPSFARCFWLMLICFALSYQFALAVGGERCSDAAVIPLLPYCDTGTTVGHVDDFVVPCATGGTAPDVVYSYTPAVTQVISASLCGSAYNTAIHIWRECPTSGVLICCNDNACGVQSCCNNVTVVPGSRYYIIVDGGIAGGGAVAGNYLLNVVLGNACPQTPCVQTCPFQNRDSEPLNNACGPNNQAIVCGDTLCGNINPLGDIDFYTFRIPIGTPCQQLLINVYGDDTPFWFPFGQGLDPVVTLVAADCATPLAEDDNSGTGNDALLLTPCLEPGLYFILVRTSPLAAPTTGPYVINLVCNACHCPQDSCNYASRDFEPLNDACGTNAPFVTCNDTLCGEIIPSTDIDWYTLTIPGPTCQRVTMDVFGHDTPGFWPAGQGLDPRIWLYAADCGTLLGFDNDGGTGRDSRLVSGCLAPGIYHIQIMSWGAAAPTSGPYILAVHCDPCPCPCDLVCPSNAVPEGEPCPNVPDNFNAGCSSIPSNFSPLQCNRVVCGTSFVSPTGFRDNDWYLLQTTTRDSIEWCIAAEFGVRMTIYNLATGCPATDTLFVVTADTCDTVCVVDCFEPGVYAVHIVPTTAGALPCSDYLLSTRCVPCQNICPYPNRDFEPINNVCATSNPQIACFDTLCGFIEANTSGDYYLLNVSGPECRLVALDVFGDDTPGWFPFGQGLDPIVGVYALGCASFLGEDDNSGVGNDAHFEICLEPGLYHVFVHKTAASPAGPYILATACRPCACPDTCDYGSLDLEPANNICSANNPIFTCPDTLCGEISTTDDLDWYCVVLTNTPCSQITIDVFGNDTPGWFPFGQGLDPVVSLWSDCGTQIAFDDNGGVGNDSRLVSACLPPGLYRIRVNSTGILAPTQGPYILATSCSPCQCPQPCELVCPNGAIIEGEPCPNFPDFFNSGCSSLPPDGFRPIVCNRAVCGTSIVDFAGNVDHDWYSFRTVDPDTVWWCLTAEFPVYTALYGRGPGANPCAGLDTFDCGRAETCSTICIGACLPPGEYMIEVRPIGGEMPCSDYVGQLNCTICTPPVCETPDSVVIVRADSLGLDMQLYWPPVPGASEYYVYRSTVYGTAPSIATFIAATPDTFYIDPGIVGSASLTNFYRIVTHVRPDGCR